MKERETATNDFKQSDNMWGDRYVRRGVDRQVTVSKVVYQPCVGVTKQNKDVCNIRSPEGTIRRRLAKCSMTGRAWELYSTPWNTLLVVISHDFVPNSAAINIIPEIYSFFKICVYKHVDIYIYLFFSDWHSQFCSNPDLFSKTQTSLHQFFLTRHTIKSAKVSFTL